MAPVIGHAGAVAPVIGAAAIVVARRRIVARAAIVTIGVIVVVAAGISGRNRQPRAYDASKGGCGSRATSTIVAATGAEIGGTTGAGCRRQAFLLRGRRGNRNRRPDRGEHGRRDTSDHGRSAQ